MPKISIIIPTFNRYKILYRSIKSVLSQTFLDYEIIIINDASTDGTKDFLEKISKEDKRIIVVNHEKNYYPDISKTLNEGIDLARGEYIARLDDDDFWIDKNKLQKQVDFLDSHKDYVLVGGGMIVIDENDNELFRYFNPETDSDIRNSAFIKNPFSHSTVMFKKDVAISVGGYGNDRYSEDWAFWLSLGEQGKLYNFPEYFAYYTLSNSNKSLVFQTELMRENLHTIFSHRKNYPNFVFGYVLNSLKLFYSYIPLSIRAKIHPVISNIKRNLKI